MCASIHILLHISLLENNLLAIDENIIHFIQAIYYFNYIFS